jgi:hypothetical protein
MNPVGESLSPQAELVSETPSATRRVALPSVSMTPVRGNLGGSVGRNVSAGQFQPVLEGWDEAIGNRPSSVPAIRSISALPAPGSNLQAGQFGNLYQDGE